MFHKILFLSLTATLAALATASDAKAWGAYHVGYTHVGPNGVQHYGRTAGVGPYGGYSGAHYGAYGAGGGAYHAGYGAASGGAYRYGGYHYGGMGGYGGNHYGYARRW